jgi:hypothetical protein
MLDTILKWWNRKWSNWEFDDEVHIFTDDKSKRPIERYDRFKRKSNDGLVEYKRVRK